MASPEEILDAREIEQLLAADLPPPSARRYAWVLTGSGHFLRESVELAIGLPAVDFLLTRAAEEILPMYGWTTADLRRALGARGRLLRDTTASGVPVGLLYRGHYHTVVVAPATSNTIAKTVAGISDTLGTNMLAQAGKCRIDSIVFACDTEPVVVTDAPTHRVVLYPRAIDLENVQRLSAFEYTTVVASPDELSGALAQRNACLNLTSPPSSS